MRLHELTAAGLQIEEAMQQEPEQWATSLAAVQAEFNEKAVACGHVYRNLNAEAEVYENEAKRLQDKAASLRKQAEHLRQYVEDNFNASGVEGIKGETFQLKFRKLPDIVDVFNEADIPSKYLQVIPEQYRPMKDDIKKALQAGEDVPGAQLLTDRRKLEIK